MTDERLADIENRALNPQISIINIGENKDVIKVYNQDSINDVLYLIAALRTERAKVAELTNCNKGLTINYQNSWNRVLEANKEIESLKAKVEELQNIIDYIVDKESVITSYNKVKIIANPNYPARYITKDGLIDVK